jgi:hypothetical protein
MTVFWIVLSRSLLQRNKGFAEIDGLNNMSGKWVSYIDISWHSYHMETFLLRGLYLHVAIVVSPLILMASGTARCPNWGTISTLTQILESTPYGGNMLPIVSRTNFPNFQLSFPFFLDLLLEPDFNYAKS